MEGAEVRYLDDVIEKWVQNVSMAVVIDIDPPDIGRKSIIKPFAPNVFRSTGWNQRSAIESYDVVVEPNLL